MLTTANTNNGNGDITTNRIEGAWTVLKRMYHGTYINLPKKHLQKYVDEFVYRYNLRDIGNSDRFNCFLCCADTRYTYKQIKESDMSKNEKWGTGSPYMVPTMSILNPEYTFSVSKKQTAAGTADMMSHTMENYFSMENADCQKFMAEGLLRTMIKNGPVAIAQPDNYEARANLMWAGTHAINGVVGDGCSPAWCVHPMEHELSAFYDITHGEGLAILTPAWMEHILNDDTLPMFVEFAKNVWGLSGDDDYALAHCRH